MIMSLHSLNYPTLNISLSAISSRRKKGSLFAGIGVGLVFERLFIKVKCWLLAGNLAKAALKFEQLNSSLRDIDYEKAKELLPEILRMIQMIEGISSDQFTAGDRQMNRAVIAIRKVLYKHEAIVKKIVSSHESVAIPTEDYIKNGLSKFSSEAIK